MRLPITLLLAFCTLALLTAQTQTVSYDHAVYFASDSHLPSAEQQDLLVDYAARLVSYADYTLSIEAFTDEQGRADYNQALAERRAAAIESFLRDYGVTAVATEVKAYGEGRAHQATTTDEERQTDRRVDLVATVTKWTSADAALTAIQDAQRQTFTIDPTQPETIDGAKGGVFIMDPNSLVDENGNAPVGPVTVELIEAYELPDMLLLGLSTTSGGRNLQTGGMIKLTAEDVNGHALQLKPGGKIASSIPTQNYREDMLLFQGDELDPHAVPTNWAQLDNPVSGSAADFLPANRQRLTEEECRLIVTGKVDKVIRIHGKQGKKKDYWPSIMRHRAGQSLYAWLKANPRPVEPPYPSVADYRMPPRPEVKDTVVESYRPRGMERVFMSKKKRDQKTAAMQNNAVRRYARKQKQYDRHVAYRNSLPSRNAAARRQFVQDSIVYVGKLEDRRQKAINTLTQLEYALEKYQFERYQAYREAKLKAFEANLLASGDLTDRGYDIKRYFFNLTNLGWANCDIFEPEEEKVQVLAALDTQLPDTRVLLIPAGRNSVLSYSLGKDGVWRNGGIPVGLAYQVISYEVQDGQLVLAHARESAAAEGTVTHLVYEPVALTDLRRRLTSLMGSK